MSPARLAVLLALVTLCGCVLAQPRVLGQPQSQLLYFQCKGTKQGQFASEGPAPRWVGWQAGLDLEFKADAPVDRATGLPTGRLQLTPLQIVRAVGPASPQLLAALSTNEVLSQVIIHFPPGPNDSAWYEMTLYNARVVSLRQYLAPAPGEAATGPLRLLEAISLRYQRLTQRHVASGRETMVDNGP
jgi:type VI secretion system Hcp family effector